MLVVGLTGGIGSGKTTVSNMFAHLGVPIIDADEIAKAITQVGQPTLQKIIEHFKQPITLADGSLDRAKLRSLIFTNPDDRIWLEKLLHPIILSEMEKQIRKLAEPYCIAVIPLLFETGPHHFIDRILTIDTPEHAQIARTIARDKRKQEEIQSIIHAQAKREHRINLAHDVITNDGVIDHLIPQVESLHLLYTQLGSPHHKK